MTVPANLNRVDYTGTGSAGPFTVPFPFYDASHLTVLQTDALFNQTTLSGWTATGAGGPSGAVTLAAACPVGSTLTIMRIVPLTQITSIKNQEAFYPEVHEQEMDLLAMADQQLDEAMDRTLRLPAGLSGVDMTLPRPDPGHALVWNAAGDGLENAGAASATLQQDLADSADVAKGDDMIAVLQPFTGAVARTQHDKNAEWVTPDDFGSVGNGIYDDTIAIQHAFNSSKKVRFLPGKTYISSRLIVSEDLEICGYGSILKHKDNSASTGVGLLEMKVDKKLVIRGLKIDGNGSTMSGVTRGYYNMVWCSIGSIELYDCWFGNSKGNAVRTGNIDDFNASYFAHDIIIDNCKIIQSRTTDLSGDCLRIERTRGESNIVSNCYIDGGLSGLRSQLYCKNLKIFNNEICYSWADVGITVAMSEHLEIKGNYCHHHFNHGFEIDGVVDCQNTGNRAMFNGGSGFTIAEFGAAAYADSPLYHGSIAEGYGTNYSNQIKTSPYVPNINTVHSDNISIGNGSHDRLSGLNTDVFKNNYLSKNNATYHDGQLSIEGGSLNRSGVKVINNTFDPNSNDDKLIKMYNYSFDSYVSGNKNVSSYHIPQANFAAKGMKDLNEANVYCMDSTKRSAGFTAYSDSLAKLGSCIRATPSGTSGYTISNVFGSGEGEKLLRINARVASGTATVTPVVNLYNGVTYVRTLLESPINLTTTYQEFQIRVPGVSYTGDKITIEVTGVGAGVDIRVQEASLYVRD